MRSSRLFSASSFWVALLLFGRGANGLTTVGPSNNPVPKTITVPFQQTVIPSGYATYSIPPFSVHFKTLNSLSGDPEMDATLLESEIAMPLKIMVGRLIYDMFNSEVSALVKSKANVSEVILDFTNVDFTVTIQHQFTLNPNRRQRQLTLQEDERQYFLEFYSEFVGIAFFIAPTDTDAEIPKADYMYTLMLEWMNKNINDGVEELINSFTSSPLPTFYALQTLSIDTAIEVGGKLDPTQAVNDPLPLKEPEQQEQFGHGVQITFVVFISLVLVLVGAALFRYSAPYIIPYFQDHSIDPTAMHMHNRSATSGNMGLERPMSPRGSDHNSHDPKKNDPLPGRRAGDADEEDLMRQQSDRWLMENRPDLYEVVQRTTSARTLTIEENPKRVSLPFQFLVGGLLRRSKQQPEEPQTHARHFSEGQDPEPHNMEEGAYLDGVPAWWTKVLQGLKGQKLACDEDPTQYAFPFKDFPRRDGTPCLMYTETSQGLVRVLRTDDSNISNQPFSPSDPLSNEDFKRVLSLNSDDDALRFDERFDEEEEDEILFDATPTSASNQSPEFTEKLQRLIEMRLRHYERQAILDKHKKKSDQRFQDEESRQRELKLRRHEMELDMNEIEAQWTPRAVTDRRPADPAATPSGGSPPGNEDRRAHHRVTASDPDFYVGARKGSGNVKPYNNRSSSIGDIESIMESPGLERITAEGSRGILRQSPPRPEVSKHSPTTSEQNRRRLDPPTSGTTGTGPSATLAKSKLSRNPSHRRWASHGTGSSDADLRKSASMDCLDRRTPEDGSSDDVMTFGIAAYTNFV